MKTTAILALLLSAAACATANQPTFVGAPSPHRDFSKIAVFVAGMDPYHAGSIETRVCASLAPTQCVSGKKLLSPTTDSPREIGQALTQANVDGVLVVVLGDDQTTSAYLRSVMADSSSSAAQPGTASLYRDIAKWNLPPQPTTEDRASSVPLYTYDRRAHAIVGLIDRNRGSTVWGGQLNVSAPGEASVMDDNFVDAATRELVVQLRQKRLIAPAAAPPNGR